MKIRNILSAVMFMSIFTAMSAQNVTSEVKQDGFQSSVKSVYSTMYEAYYNDNDDLLRGDILERLQTEYNSKGQRKNMIYLSTEEDIMFRSRYKHDGFGITTLEQIVDNEEHVIGRTYFIYDENFVLTESYVEDAERQMENRILYKYDGQGRLSQRSFNDPKNEIYKREVYNYNFDGTILKTVTYGRDGHKMNEIRYENDDHKQVTSQTLYDYSEPETECFITLYRYQYDNRNNWIQKTEYQVNGERIDPVYITEREIVYF